MEKRCGHEDNIQFFNINHIFSIQSKLGIVLTYSCERQKWSGRYLQSIYCFGLQNSEGCKTYIHLFTFLFVLLEI